MSFRSGGVRRRLALLTLFVVIVTPAVFGDDIDPNQVPEARIKPPIGSQSSAINPNELPAARILPPGGVQSASIDPIEPPEARIKPPGGWQSASFFDRAGEWLGFYVHLMPLLF
jgi:hypothetical protein